MSNPKRKDYRHQLLNILQAHSAFKEFSEADLAHLVSQAKFGFCEQGEQIIKQGDSRREFFIVLEGQLRAIDTTPQTPRLLNYHPVGSIVGSRALLYHRARAATVEVVIDAVVAVFDETVWHWLYENHPETIEALRQLERRYDHYQGFDFPGRQQDETVVVAVKRHLVTLLPPMMKSFIWLIGPMIFFVISMMTYGTPLAPWVNHTYVVNLFTIPFFILTGLSMLYSFLDWRNDDFIVTTKRVIHIERILFYGEERQEAPLPRIQDVTIISEGLLSHIFDYHDVEIATAGAGVIKLTGIPKATAIKEALLQERHQATARLKAADVASLRQALAHRLDWPEILEQNVMAVAEAQGIILTQTPTRRLPGLLNYLLPRTKEVIDDEEEGLVILWRRHYAILLKMVLWPLLILLPFGSLLIASLLGGTPFSPTANLFWQLILGLGSLSGLVWYLWRYDGWWRDVYLVTPHRIVDVASSPFQTKGETRREGTFDNIQNITYNIPNFYSKLLNLGDVVIETAGSKETFTFEQVLNPSAVHQEIVNRMILHQQRRREREREAATHHIIEMIGEYHHLYEKVSQPASPPPRPDLKKAA